MKQVLCFPARDSLKYSVVFADDISCISYIMFYEMILWSQNRNSILCLFLFLEDTVVIMNEIGGLIRTIALYTGARVLIMLVKEIGF